MADMTPRRPGLAALALLMLGAGAALATDPEPRKPSRLHEPAEIMKIMESSAVVYELDVDESFPPARIDSPRVLTALMVLHEDGKGNDTLDAYSLSDEASALLKAGEEAYEKRDYDAALEAYQKLRKAAPDYGHALTLMGDTAYSRGDLEKARRWFEEAINANFADYQAHWFLADTLWKLGKQEEAIRSLTTAHLLNVNHEKLRERLLAYRTKAGRPWKDWTYAPRYEVKKEGDKVKVRFAKDWLGYAVVKAVWAFEPNYAHDMVGPDYEKRIITMEEEKEALMAHLATHPEAVDLGKIVTDGYAEELFLYEMAARRAPEAIVLLPRKLFMRLVDYVETYH